MTMVVIVVIPPHGSANKDMNNCNGNDSGDSTTNTAQNVNTAENTPVGGVDSSDGHDDGCNPTVNEERNMDISEQEGGKGCGGELRGLHPALKKIAPWVVCKVLSCKCNYIRLGIISIGNEKYKTINIPKPHILKA